jgi:uncharacterized phage infection (PIP) family protein YhgE
MSVGLALATVSCVLLALVAGLLLLLGQLLRGMRRELREAPLLAEKLAQQLLAVRQGLEQARQEMNHAAHKLGPDLNQQLQAAQTTVSDLKFLIARGEQTANRMEHANGAKIETTITKTVQTLEQPMVQQMESTVATDPLENLLAELGDAAGSGSKAIARRPSQAEIELRAKERN